MTKNIIVAIAVCFFAVSFAGVASAQNAKVAGSWTIDTPGAGRGGVGTSTLTITQDGANLKGTLKGANGTDTPLDSIAVTGNKIDFILTRQGRGGPMKLEFEGTIDGDNMSGTFKTDGSFGGDWNGKRG